MHRFWDIAQNYFSGISTGIMNSKYLDLSVTFCAISQKRRISHQKLIMKTPHNGAKITEVTEIKFCPTTTISMQCFFEFCNLAKKNWHFLSSKKYQHFFIVLILKLDHLKALCLIWAKSLCWHMSQLFPSWIWAYDYAGPQNDPIPELFFVFGIVLIQLSPFNVIFHLKFEIQLKIRKSPLFILNKAKI